MIGSGGGGGVAITTGARERSFATVNIINIVIIMPRRSSGLAERARAQFFYVSGQFSLRAKPAAAEAGAVELDA